MDNIINYYPVTEDIEVLVADDDGRRVFVVVNTDLGLEAEISEEAAKVLCMTPLSLVRPSRWEDFCTARGVFQEDN